MSQSTAADKRADPRSAIKSSPRRATTAPRADIAKEAGSPMASYYFKNKEEVLNTIFRERWGPSSTRSVCTRAGASTREKFTNICFFLVNSYNQRPELMEC
jgi:hypothetical protein